jgi:hypothetical protein
VIGKAQVDHRRGDASWMRRSGVVRSTDGRIVASVPQTVAERFWALVDKSGDCWIWRGAQGSTGYGTFHPGKRLELAHRVSYELAHGPIPDGYQVCHRCDVRLCVNPAHLFAGTQSENLQDARRKGRLTAGERHPMARLTDAQVAEIRAACARGESQIAVARRFNTSRGHVGRLVRGTSRRTTL